MNNIELGVVILGIMIWIGGLLGGFYIVIKSLWENIKTKGITKTIVWTLWDIITGLGIIVISILFFFGILYVIGYIGNIVISGIN